MRSTLAELGSAALYGAARAVPANACAARAGPAQAWGRECGSAAG